MARLYLGSEAQILGRGGKQLVSKLAGVSGVRIDKGIADLTAGKTAAEAPSPGVYERWVVAENNIKKASLGYSNCWNQSYVHTPVVTP